MASRLAKRKKEEEQFAPASRRRQAQVRAMLEAPQPKPQPKSKPNLSNSIKETLNKPLISKSEIPNTSALDPTIGKPKNAITKFDPITSITRAVDITGNPIDTTPAKVEQVAATTVLPEKPKTVNTRVVYEYNPVTQTREKKVITVNTSEPTADYKEPTRLKNETDAQFEERKQRTLEESKRLAAAGLTSADKEKAILKQADDINKWKEENMLTYEEVQASLEAKRQKEERMKKVGLENVNSFTITDEELDAHEKDYNSVAGQILRGLTKTADILIGKVAPIIGGAAGTALAQVYKAYAPEGSEYYSDKSFGDKTVGLITDMTKDKAKDIALGSLKSVGNAIQQGVKGYRRVGKGSGNLIERSIVPTQTPSKIKGGQAFPEGSNIRGAPAATPTVPTPQPLKSGTKLQLPAKPKVTTSQPTRVGPAPRGKGQAPQRLNAPRTDVLISPRQPRPPPRGIRR